MIFKNFFLLLKKKISFIYLNSNIYNKKISSFNDNPLRYSPSPSLLDCLIKYKKKKINIIKSSINKDKKFDIKMIMKKLYKLKCRNLLIEGGSILTNHLLKKKIFNQFYLFKSPKQLSKLVEYKEFKGFKTLSQKYKIKLKLKSNFGKDTVILYKN